MHAKASYPVLGFHGTSGKYKLFDYGHLPATRTTVAGNLASSSRWVYLRYE